ncbi:hypothetical protein RSAG8_12823, partial [Rhizoctonia solani AG-8 WAC10335]
MRHQRRWRPCIDKSKLTTTLTAMARLNEFLLLLSLILFTVSAGEALRSRVGHVTNRAGERREP